jgi:AcrR family transcriptional regulator
VAKKRNLTKEKIVAAARELAGEIGMQQVNFQNLADKLAISYPSLYNHFKNMGAVKKAMTAQLIAELNERLRRVLVGKSMAQAIKIYAVEYEQFASENQAVYEVLINVPKTQDELLIDAMHETNDIFIQILENYELNAVERTNKSREFRSLIHGYISLRSLGYFTKVSLVSAEESYRMMIQDFIDFLEFTNQKRLEKKVSTT